MVKNFCDCCGKEFEKSDRIIKFKYLCHIESILDCDLDCHIDRNGNRISMREEIKDLCIICYNLIMVDSVKKYRGLKNNVNSKTI